MAAGARMTGKDGADYCRRRDWVEGDEQALESDGHAAVTPASGKLQHLDSSVLWYRHVDVLRHPGSLKTMNERKTVFVGRLLQSGWPRQ